MTRGEDTSPHAHNNKTDKTKRDATCKGAAQPKIYEKSLSEWLENTHRTEESEWARDNSLWLRIKM